MYESVQKPIPVPNNANHNTKWQIPTAQNVEHIEGHRRHKQENNYSI